MNPGLEYDSCRVLQWILRGLCTLPSLTHCNKILTPLKLNYGSVQHQGSSIHDVGTSFNDCWKMLFFWLAGLTNSHFFSLIAATDLNFISKNLSEHQNWWKILHFFKKTLEKKTQFRDYFHPYPPNLPHFFNNILVFNLKNKECTPKPDPSSINIKTRPPPRAFPCPCAQRHFQQNQDLMSKMH